jgi:hypothetical protein
MPHSAAADAAPDMVAASPGAVMAEQISLVWPVAGLVVLKSTLPPVLLPRFL